MGRDTSRHCPPLWESPGSGSRWGLEGSSLPKAGGSLEPNPRRQGLSGSSAGLKARSPPLQVTSSGLTGCGRRAPGPLSGGGEGQGWGAGEPAPPPVNRRFRTFFTRPTPFLPLPSLGRVPVRPPFLPHAAGGACTSAGSGSRAEATPSPSRPRLPFH